MSNKKGVVVDGNSLIYRCYYGSLNQLDYYKKHGIEPANAIKLFLNIIFRILENKNYDYALVAFDHAKKNIRHEDFEDYKAGRQKMPEDLVIQLPKIVEYVSAFGIKAMSLEGFEADDLIGSFANVMNKNDVDVEIYSSDKDMLQLVNDATLVNLFKVGVTDIQTINNTNFEENYFGLKPSQVVDFKGISGDSSDNLKGIPGIGPKTAAELLKKYDTLENIFANVESLPLKQQEKFKENIEHALLCKKLATINKTIFDNKEVNEFLKNPTDMKTLEEIIKKHNFSGFDKYLKN